MRLHGWSMRARVIALLVATLLPLAALTGYWLLWEARAERANAQREARDIAERIAGRAGYRVAAVHEMLEVFEHLPPVREGNGPEAGRLFRALLRDSPHLENIGLVAADGSIVATAVPGPRGVQISLSDREWFQQVMASGRPAAGGFQLSRVAGKPVVVLAHPVQDRSGRLTGVVFAALRLDTITHAVSAGQGGLETPYRWAVVDARRTVLLGSGDFVAAGQPLPALGGLLVAETGIPGTPWRVVAGIPEGVVAERVRQPFVLVGLPAAAILLLAAGGGIAIARGTWRPLQALTASIRRIEAGEAEVPIPVVGGGEAGELAEAFRGTLGTLTRRQSELAALLRANQALASSLELEQILQLIVEQAAAISMAPAVRLFLLGGTPPVLRWRVGIGTPPEEERDLVIPVGESFSGQVAATGKPLAVPDCRDDPRVVHKAHVERYRFISYLGLPVALGDHVLGVLVFNTSAPRTYTPDEIAYLGAFAQQAALAIQNARLYDEMRLQAADLEVRVRERTAELEEALRVKAEFLAKMSHELRTPLNFIVGFTGLLKDGTGGSLTSKQKQFVDRIHTGGQQLLALVSDLMDLSLMEAGQSRLQLEDVPLAPLVQEIQDLFSVQATQKHLTLGADLASDLLVVADRRKLAQVLANLVNNAMKFTPEGGRITVTARHVDQSSGPIVDPSLQVGQLTTRPIDAPTDWLELAVEDTGIGLAAGDLERIFRGFEQVDPSPTRPRGGAGIGLALVRTLVELHGGRVWAESGGLGQGARFVVRLPRLRAPEPKRILVVEDNPGVLKPLTLFLQEAEYAVTGVRTGAEALATIAARPMDLIILDLGLPDLDGWEVLKRVRTTETTRNLPVLVLTGMGVDQADQAVALGANEFLTKPISFGALTRLVKDLLTGAVPHPARPSGEKG